MEISEDLITDLSRIPGVFVIARNSAWAYKDKPVAASLVARELGVRYILDGSVRRDGDRVRINAKFIDTASGHLIWADRYEGTLADLLALQDQVVSNIVSALAVRLPSPIASAAKAGETTKPEAMTRCSWASSAFSSTRKKTRARQLPISEEPSSLIPATVGPMPP